MSEANVVDIPAGPVKRFFIDILTRDISLSAAILDLVDNSVDSARSLRGDGDLAGLQIRIEISPERFSITDNCAGISVQDAKDYVFRLGRPPGVDGVDGSIGQFGVGMKRALFKLGHAFQVDSRTAESHFVVDVDIVQWEQQPNWTIPLTEYANEASSDTGTAIVVDPVDQRSSAALMDLITTGDLQKELASRHRIAIERGLFITVNGAEVVAEKTILAVADDAANLYPLVDRFEETDLDGNRVEVKIYAGVFATQTSPTDAEPEDALNAEGGAGWYVFANDRLLIKADRDRLTGWGTGKHGLPIFHNQYARFRGYVFMSAVRPSALPWNTTKTGVEVDDSVWIAIRRRMITAGRQVIPFLNLLKNERAAHRVDETVATPIADILATAKQLSAGQLDQVVASHFSHPAPNPAVQVRLEVKTINYTLPLDIYDAVAGRLGLDVAADVGRYTFDYYREHSE
jgi:hypothetical protein